ncbi:MAG: signal peptidase II [Longimicrobiales bacterium]|nr:signal peptidase II [Longimicrobiales bacterium]
MQKPREEGSEGVPHSYKTPVLLGVVSPILVLDWLTKRWALDALPNNPQELLGGLLPLTLAFNRGAAFGLSIGDDSRWFFVPVTILALGLIVALYRQAESDDLLRLGALAFVAAGALGNLWDRVRWDRGVVDFLGPVDLGFWDFPIFNVADVAITTGAMMLALSFWIEERQDRETEGDREPSSSARPEGGSRRASDPGVDPSSLPGRASE